MENGGAPTRRRAQRNTPLTRGLGLLIVWVAGFGRDASCSRSGWAVRSLSFDSVRSPQKAGAMGFFDAHLGQPRPLTIGFPPISPTMAARPRAAVRQAVVRGLLRFSQAPRLFDPASEQNDRDKGVVYLPDGRSFSIVHSSPDSRLHFVWIAMAGDLAQCKCRPAERCANASICGTIALDVRSTPQASDIEEHVAEALGPVTNALVPL